MVEAAIRPGTEILTFRLMMVNNEIGTITDVAAIGEMAPCQKRSSSISMLRKLQVR